MKLGVFTKRNVNKIFISLVLYRPLFIIRRTAIFFFKKSIVDSNVNVAALHLHRHTMRPT